MFTCIQTPHALPVGVPAVGFQQPSKCTKDYLYVQQVCLVKRGMRFHRRLKGVLVPSAGSSVFGVCHGSKYIIVTCTMEIHIKAPKTAG